MATTFLETGGDATFNVALTTNGGFWNGVGGGGMSVVTDIVHGAHIKSIKHRPNQNDTLTMLNTVVKAGGRMSVYIYIVTLPSSTTPIYAVASTVGTICFALKLTSAGILQMWSNSVQIGTNGSTLSTGQWYRISLAYTITDTTHNRFELFVNGVSSLSITNATLDGTTVNDFYVGNIFLNSTLELRSSDYYVDNLTTLVDTGDIWVTAKRPNANGTTNNFNVQIGSGGSSYGTGHSPQVNERPLSTTNGWSVVAVGATTEEYNVESASTGDFNLTVGTNKIVDYMGWVYASALVSETASIMLNGATSNISLTSSNTMFTKMAGATTYPAGTGTDIGIVTDATATTVSLFECGIMVAFIPSVTGSMLTMFQ